MEWRRPSRTGRTCTFCDRHEPPGCARWACPSSWRWSRTGRTWTSSHLQPRQRDTQPFAVICCRYFKHTFIHSSCAASWRPVSPPGWMCRRKVQKGMFHCTKITPHNVLVWVFYFSFYCVSEANILEELLRLLQHMIRKKKSTSLYEPLQTDSVQTVQLFTECRMMFSFTPQYNCHYCWSLSVGGCARLCVHDF